MSWQILIPYAAWLNNTPFAMWLGQATWRIAALLTLHLFGLTALLGSILVTSLRLLGLFQVQKPIAQLRKEIAPATAAGLTLMVATGALIFTGGAEAYYQGYWFRLKMVLLLVALVFHFTIFRTVTRADEGHFTRAACRLTGAAALVLWFGVGWAGRAIAFF
jgi:uncharacterized membrane protein SirB2